MHLKIAYSICHWTYHLKLSEKMSQFTDHIPDSSKYLPSILFNQQEASNKPSNELVTNTSTVFNSVYYDDNRPKLLMASTSTNGSSSHSSGSKANSSESCNRRNNNDTFSGDLINSETIYRNEIRKSIRNVMQHKNRSRNAINRNSCMAQFNNGLASISNQGLVGSNTISVAASKSDNFKSGSFYYKPSQSQGMYKNARQIISDESASGFYLNSTPMVNEAIAKQSCNGKNSVKKIYYNSGRYNAATADGEGSNGNLKTLTICSSGPSKFETLEQNNRAPVLLLNRGPPNEYESRV